MERMRSEERPRAIPATCDDTSRRLAASAGMLVFLVGLAVLFVTNAPS
jgi:hypothetical protein